MTPRFRVVPLLALVFAGSAFAQAPEGAMPEGSMPAAPSEEEPMDPPPVPDALPPGQPGELDANGVYTIKGGDTLWDISQRFLNNPWYWPKIWADNPVVDNPHWIYPGNALRIRFGGDGLPAEITAEPMAEVLDPDEELPVGKRAELADFTTGTFDKADALGQDSDLVSISGRRGIGIAPPSTLKLKVASLVTAGELVQAGTISASFEQKELLSTYDRCYVQFKDLGAVNVGESYSIFRTGREIVHPVTKRSFGYQTIILGTMKIVAKDGAVAIGEIANVNEDIKRGDRIGPAAVLEKTVKPSLSTRAIDGVVLATEIPNQTWIGESHVVFIDQGSEAGVQEGNVFTVVQGGDGLEKMEITGPQRSTRNLPTEPVATLVVFDVRAQSAAAMVVKSLREVAVGDRVETRPIGGAGGD